MSLDKELEKLNLPDHFTQEFYDTVKRVARSYNYSWISALKEHWEEKEIYGVQFNKPVFNRYVTVEVTQHKQKYGGRVDVEVLFTEILDEKHLVLANSWVYGDTDDYYFHDGE